MRLNVENGYPMCKNVTFICWIVSNGSILYGKLIKFSKVV